LDFLWLQGELISTSQSHQLKPKETGCTIRTEDSAYTMYQLQ